MVPTVGVAVLALAALVVAAKVVPEDAPEMLTAWGEDLRMVGMRKYPSVADTLPPRADLSRVNETSFFLSMRDGVRLWTVVSVPEGLGVVGTVLFRTPYGTATCASDLWNERGFAVVCQVRVYTDSLAAIAFTCTHTHTHTHTHTRTEATVRPACRSHSCVSVCSSVCK
jgi:hypothetical protein